MKLNRDQLLGTPQFLLMSSQMQQDTKWGVVKAPKVRQRQGESLIQGKMVTKLKLTWGSFASACPINS